ncbi:alpha-2-macroglobulin family protein [Chitinophaga nivalis]|uniref:MG2 domain-containing protein n=1 Tax=Chitinophaga nivalis TaxID=2991709 RepID=A0ABT3ITS7_9BACT|nr:MG2 domain-containing protein [Chitinophaga nivalis]MCW3462928.1 MG2 domain-containing protein [Chitinophaga nivalis]MCW3487382.1 MG2 domain-containing protein [Chitinophaga nivalis]
MHPTKRLFAVAALFVCLTALSVLIGCRTTKKEMNPEFAKYIEAYTAGIISKQSAIRVHLSGQVNVTHTQNEALDKEVFSFSPSVKGKSYWIDATTIEFRPDENLQPGKTYQATFKLGKVMEVPKDLKSFDFEFKVIKPSFALDHMGLKASSNNTLEQMTYTGSIATADVEDPQAIEKVLHAQYNGKSLPVSWQHNAAQKTSRFTVSNIMRGNIARNLEITWNGQSLKVDNSGKKTVEVPAIGDFKVLDVKTLAEPEQHLLVQFSDPISAAQTLEGLIGISGQSDLRYTIDGSEVKVYAPVRLEGNYNVIINEGIQNITDKRLGKTFSANVNFENTLPSVQIPGKGVILPESNKLVMPFEAVNLNAVDVTIIKIYENNVPQYLQRNNLSGNEELRRVGKPVVEKTIRLDTDKSVNLRKKNRFFLDLDKMLRTEPGAIYNITIGFRKAYALTACAADTGNTAEAAEEESEYYGGEKIDDDDEFWQRYDSYYPYGYNWDRRNDACSNSYYSKDKWAVRNVFSSNIGLIAKRGNDNSMLVAVTDIRDTKPMIGVELELLDYQNQVIFKTKSDGEGLALFDLKRKPFLLIAKKGNERGYLKLDDGSSLPLSRFDVKGEEVQNGIKGFLYGERGVWRPGDSLYLTFILEDKEKKLPPDHPVTLELYNPKGQLYKRVNQHQGLNGFYSFATATAPDDPTGSWVAKVKVGGATFQKNIRIETVKPNRLKIKMDFGSQTSLSKGGAPGNLSAMWLFGATAQHLKAKVDVSLVQQRTSFKNFSDYSFDDPVTHFEAENKTIFEGPLNENGTAPVNADIQLGKLAPGQLKANFEVKVFEPGGDFSIDHFSMPYNPFTAYAGLRIPQGDRTTGMLLTDKPHSIDIVDVDGNGNLIGGSRDVQVELYKIRWRWWWDEGENEDYSNFTQDSYNQLLRKETITLQNGKGKWNLQINYPDWGRYLVRVKDLQSGHTSGKAVYIDWPGWAERVQKESPADASMLVFTSDKQQYKTGDDITLTIPSSAGGRGLVSIESGSKVLKTFWLNTQQGQTTFKFKAEKNMTPNIYVNVSLLQPHAQTINDLPIRMFGTIPISIEDPGTILKPVITMPEKLKPETEATLTVSETNGKAMTYTVAIVDEGLLDLTRYKTPDPHSIFYAREALGVKTWDLFDYVIGAWGADMDRILSIGGDEGLNKNAGNAKANRFKPVVKYMGPFYLKGGQKQTHKFKLPPYIGSVKAMVIAGQDGAYGFAEKNVAVKKPLMLLATAPRVLGPSETIQLPVTVFGLEPNIRNASVTLSTSPLLEVVGERTKTVTFSQPGEQQVYFDVRVRPQTGIAKIKVTATSGSEKAEENIELDVRNPNPVITNVIEYTLESGKAWNTAYSPVGMAGTNSGVLEVSTIPSLNLGKRLRFLIEYPHGCIEQTTSGLFPQLVLNQLMDLKEGQLAEIDRNVKAGINRLKGFQTSDGGFSYWPGEGNADEWGTSYGGHFLLAAQEQGYTLPPGVLDQWKKYQRNKAATWAPNTLNFYGSDLTQAYRLYLLALAKVPELGAMNRLKEFKYLSVPAKWRLAAAYKLSGQPEVANSLVQNINTDIKPYNQLGGTFGSDLRDKAMILETLTILGQRNRANELVKQIAAQLSQNDQWYSTQTTGYSLIAIAKYCGSNKGGSKMNFSYTLNGVKGNVNGASFVTQIPVTFNSNAGNISLQNNGQNLLYVRLILQGQPEAGQEPVATNNPDILGLQVTYSTRDGKPLDPATLKQGSDFMATVSITNPGKRGYYEQMALSQIFPSGWEILNTRLMDNDSAFHTSPATYKDIRDDRVYTYFNLEENKKHIYHVLLNAAYLGRYYLPATACEAMYDNNIHAFLPGKWVEVVK